MHTIFHYHQNEVSYRGIRQSLIILWPISSDKTQKNRVPRDKNDDFSATIHRIMVYIAYQTKLPNLYKRPHVNIFICIEMTRHQNRNTKKNTWYFMGMSTIFI